MGDSAPSTVRTRFALKIQVDDIFAALILSLVMMRRLEVKSAAHELNPNVPRERFEEWRKLALRAYDQVAVACAAKVSLNVGWYFLGQKLGVEFPWYQLPGLLLFMAWMVALVWAWKIGTDARYLRLQLGIELKRPRPAART
jgi:hypothetical protein